MKTIGPFLLLLAAGPAQAASVAPKPVVVPPSAPAAATQAPAARRFPGVSDEGNAILAKAQSTPDPQQQAISRQLKAAHDQVIAAVMAPVIDLDKVSTAIRAEEAAQALARTHNNDRLIAVLKQLPDDDKGIFLRTLILSRQPRPAGAPTPSTPQP
jgi:uncharacterized membrane protein